MTRKLGLALGGGGARGLAHLGVLIALEQAEIPVSMIAGTSMGAVMGAMKAIGADLTMARRVLEAIDLNEILQVTDSALRELQKLIGRSVMEYVRGSTWKEEGVVPHDLARLCELFTLLTANKSFADTTLPFAAVAADLETGERVVLRDGSLANAITASTAVPGVFSPVPLGGRLLIDGGILEKLPVDVVIEMGAESVLAVDTGAPLDRKVDTCLDAILQSQRATSQYLTHLQLRHAREQLGDRLLVLRPPIGWITMFAFDHTEDAIQAGEDIVHAHLDQIQAMLADPVVSPTPTRSGS